MSDTNEETQEAYMIDPAGKLFRKGQHIGNLEGDSMKLLPDFKKYTAAVTRWLRAKADAEEAEPEKDKEAPAKPKLTEAEKAELDNKGMTAEAVEEAKKARAIYKDDVAFAEKTGCPPPPMKNPQYGDKTPAFVDWLKKYRPDQFAIRFGVRGTGKVPVLKTNPDTGIDEVVGYREAEFATRKTHLTEKVETSTGLGEDMSWDA